MLSIKPRIRKWPKTNIWICTGLSYMGLGLTPKQAYEHWAAVVSILVQQSKIR